MKRRIYCGVLMTLALPLGSVRAEGTETTTAETLNLLEVLTNQESTSPEVLLLIPSPSATQRPASSKPIPANSPDVLIKPANESTRGDIRKIKALQDTIGQLKGKISKQEVDLEALRNKTSQQQSLLQQSLLQQPSQQQPQASEYASLKQALLKLPQQWLIQLSNNSDKQQLIKQSQQDQQQLVSLQEQLAVQAKQNEQKTDKIKQLQQQLALTGQEHSQQRQQDQQASTLLQQQLATQRQDNQQQAEQIKQLQQQLVLTGQEHTQQLQQDQQASTLLQQQLATQRQDNQQQAEQIKQLQQQLALTGQDNARQSQQLTQLQQAQQEMTRLQQQLAAQTKDGEQKSLQLVQLQQAQQASQQENAMLQGQLATQSKENQQKTDSLKQLQQKLTDSEKQQTKLVVAAINPKSEQEKRDYAIGTALGSDILMLLDSKKTQGVEVNHQLALAGVTDVINGQPKLPQEQIVTALQASEVELNSQHKKIKQQNEQQGSQYINKFKKQPGVVKSEQGFYYRINYAGDQKFSEQDTVIVVVKESLTDGKVIKDMELTGTSISQPLSDYPPLFREAMGKLKNHGNMTLVVPPKLAYGDNGFAPDIPPAATMVYNLRILDVIAESASQTSNNDNNNQSGEVQ
ncbi:FKBP-type peptidyl-prolyl cis-trans isomerase N-terminal domain-containing protein [Serratia sp. DD3]|uniref:FKBP-type peptidyl-prolyl cis-trans isomerase N-terminal domain-containing protein n=1 Tax=Serratia sp. DD3 TaxID=1410619 RepID=UPI0003C51744|nr:FKBP-type peptidyl-prolyl cis-trans isomerase N-terminal domain-containing protein [Serratia sp. DD3]KEY56631.1 FKBP-type peptidyl-prolyl cis-trans isomerase FkpA [Serratia sp. DD3]